MRKPALSRQVFRIAGRVGLFDNILGCLLLLGYLGNEDEKDESGDDHRQEVAHNLLYDESRMNWIVTELDSENGPSCPSKELHRCENELAENLLQHLKLLL